MNKCIVFFMIAFFSILQGCDNMDIVTRGTAELNAAIVAHPGLLNNRSFKGKQLNGTKNDRSDGVHLENLVIHNLTLQDVQMRWAHLKNVTFVDCKFIKVDFRYSKFDNVKFIRGKISGYPKRDVSSDEYTCRFEQIPITRILFDGTEFAQSVSLDFGNGIVVMRNIKADLQPKQSYGLLTGTNLKVRMDNCRVSNQAAVVVLGEKGSLYATNSRFINAELNLSGTAAWIENCVWMLGGAPSTDILVIKKSQLESIGIPTSQTKENPDKLQRVFLTDNVYTKKSEKQSMGLLGSGNDTFPHDNSFLYLYANGEIPGFVRAGSGNVYIYNANIGELLMGLNTVISSLNLQNVKIKRGDWIFADLRSGKWENVEISPPVDLRKGKFGEIIGHKVTFPNGTPWQNGTLNITNSDKPLTFDKPPVPTLEETGLAQFWKENDFPKENY